MDASWLGVLIAALGSTGIAGLITSGVNFSRAVRLRKSIRESFDLAKSFSDKSPSREAMQLAADRDALRLASMSLVQHPATMRSVLVLAGAFVVLSAALIGFGAGRGGSISTFWELGAFLIGYVIALVAALDFLIRSRRDALVKAILLTGEVDIRWNGATWPKQKLVERYYYINLESQRQSVREELRKLPKP